MKDIIFLELDIWKAIVNESKLKSLKITKTKAVYLTVTLKIDDEIFEKINKDPLLQQQLTDPASAAYNKMIKGLVKEAKDLDKLCLKKDNATSKEKGLAIQNFKKNIKKEMEDLKKDAESGIRDVWKKYTKTKKEYSNYKFKASASIVMNIAGISTSIIGTVGSAGVGLAIGIYGCVKAVIGLSIQIYKLSIDADKARKDTQTKLKKLQKPYKKNNKIKSQLKQATKSFLNSIFGFNITKTINGAISSNDLYLSKLQGVEINCHKISKTLNESIIQINDLSNKVKGINSSNLHKSIEKLEKSLADKIDDIINIQKKVKEGIEWQEKTEIALNGIHEAQSSKYVDYFEKSLVLIDLSIGTATTDFKSVQSCLSLAQAVVTEVNNQLLEKL
jgi:hypothetical protein